jgi:hypothetical protein
LDGAGRLLRYLARTHPLSPRARAELAGHLTAPAGPHPWPQPLPARWSGQLQDAQPVRYTPVAPVTAVEVEVDTAFEYGRYRHPVRYRRVRLDLATSDVRPA